MKIKVGIVDTMFSRVDMAAFAVDEIGKKFPGTRIARSTVPGIKDLAIGCLLLEKKERPDVFLALGMVGKADIDRMCAHEASLGIQMAKLLIGKHIVEVFVHELEGKDEADLYSIFEDRTRKHAVNAVLLASDPKQLSKFAGMGKRQGRPDAGPLVVRGKER
ncbi:MAG: riboflavin synthase [Candidatus Micrarchaeota archaeon]|nr:riboflavin synthase [Candidatus Micrarchaeota archaeon]